MSQTRFVAAVGLCFAACLTGSQFALTQPPEKNGNVKERLELDSLIAAAVKPDPADSPLRKLQKERCSQLAIAAALIDKVIVVGRWNPQDLGEYVKLQATLFESLAELVEKPADKVKCFEMRVKTLKEFERITNLRVTAGTEPTQNLHLAKAARLDAEIAVLKLKAEIEKPGK